VKAEALVALPDLTTAACERCGCTQERACPGGCGWDPFYYAQGRAICTACSGANN
jgi:hypothetical protein